MTEQGSPQTAYRDFPANLQLFLAIRRGDSAAIVDVLERHPDLVNAEERWSIQEAQAAGVSHAGHATALVRAAERDDLGIVRLLIERGADVDQRCLSGESPLWVAVAARCPAVVRLLAEHGADVDQRAFAGNAPLHVAAMRGWDDLVALLLELGADPDQRDDAGRRPLEWARENGHRAVVRQLDPTAAPVRSVEPAAAPAAGHGVLLATGIKTIDLLAPLCHGDLIRWDPAIACAHVVFLAELTRSLLQSGYRGAVWAGFEDDHVNLRELRPALGQLGNPELVTPMFASGTLSGGERRQHVELVRAHLEARRREAPGRYLVVFYQDQRQVSDPGLAFPALNQRGEHAVTVICTTPVQDPPDRPQALELRPPLDARVAHDPVLMKRRMAPALSAVATTSRNLGPDVVSAGHLEVSAAARAVLKAYEQLDPDLYFADLFTFVARDRATAARGQRLHAFLTQPLRVGEAFSGMRGDQVSLQETLRGVRRILDGELDDTPVQQLFFSGRSLPPVIQQQVEAARYPAARRLGGRDGSRGERIELSAAVMTHPARLDAARDLQRRHPELALEIVLDPEPEHRHKSPLRTARAAWRSGPADATHRLVLQDDAVLCPDFLDHVRSAIASAPDAALSLYVEWGTYTSYGLRLAALSGSSWVEVSDIFLPAVALVLPVDVGRGFDEFAAREAGPELMDDYVLFDYARRRGVPTLVTVPNLVEHSDVPSLLGHGSSGPRRSACFAAAIPAPLRWSSTVTAPTLIPYLSEDQTLCQLRPSPDRYDWSRVQTRRLLADRGMDLEALDAALERALAGIEGGAEAAGLVGRPRVYGLWHTSVALGLALCQLWSETGGTRPLAEALADPVASVALSTAPAVVSRHLASAPMERVEAPLTALVRRGLSQGFAE